MNDGTRIPCCNCGLMMLPETGLRTGGLCMRCYGSPQDAKRNRQPQPRKPTPKTKKYSTSLTSLDLATFPIWVVCDAELDMVRPHCADRLPHFCELVVATTFSLHDGTEHQGALGVTLVRDSLAFTRPFLLLPRERIDLPDGQPQFTDAGVSFTYQSMSDSLAKNLQRDFLQKLSRLQRHMNRTLDQIFPMAFQLSMPWGVGNEPVHGLFPSPIFQLPVARGSSISHNNDILKVRNEMDEDGGRWIIAVASAYAEPAVICKAIHSVYRQWCTTKKSAFSKLDVLLQARESEPFHEELMHSLIHLWNDTRKPKAPGKLEVWLGTTENLWIGFTNRSCLDGVEKISETARFVTYEEMAH